MFKLGRRQIPVRDPGWNRLQLSAELIRIACRCRLCVRVCLFVLDLEPPSLPPSHAPIHTE